MAPPASTLPSAKICQILYGLRILQQPSVIVTGFIASYLAFWHSKLIDPIPIPLSILILASTLLYLHSHLFIYFPYLQTHSLLLKTSAPPALLLALGFGTLWAIPEIRGHQDDYFEPFRQTQGWKLADAGVEQHHKILVRILIFVGGLAVLLSAAVTGIAGYGVWTERRRGGYAGVKLNEDGGLDEEVGDLDIESDMDDEHEGEIEMKRL